MNPNSLPISSDENRAKDQSLIENSLNIRNSSETQFTFHRKRETQLPENQDFTDPVSKDSKFRDGSGFN